MTTRMQHETEDHDEEYPEPPSAILLAHITIPLHIFASGKYNKLVKHCGLFFEHVDKLPPPCDLQNAQTHINDLFEKIVNAFIKLSDNELKKVKLILLGPLKSNIENEQ